MNAPEKANLEKPGTLLGKRLPRVDAREKVTGDARYAADLNFPACSGSSCCAARIRTPASSVSTPARRSG